MATGDDSNDRAPRHQPPSGRDLQRYPAAGAVCVRVRGLLRDYADGELAGTARVEVEEHVHRCRECGVALSRAEAEVYRIREALVGRAVRPPATFTRSVMARVRAEASSAPGGREPDDAPDDFTPRVMERIRREWVRPSAARRAGAWLRRHPAAAIGAAATVLLGLGFWVAAPGDAPAATVLSARQAVVHRAGAVAAVVEGRGLRAGDVITVDDAGLVRLALPGAASAFGGVLEVAGATSVRLEGDSGGGVPLRFAVLRGACSLRVDDASLAFRCGDRTRIDVVAGSYRISVEPAVRFDGVLAREAMAAVRFDVVDGEGRILRGSRPPVVVDAGRVAHFDGWSGVAFERRFNDRELERLPRTFPGVARSPDRAPTAPVRSRDWLGQVVDPTGRSVAGATVVVRTRKGVQQAVTVGDGTFRLRDLADLENDTVLVEVRPGDLDAGLAAAGPMPVPLRSEGSGPDQEMLLARIQLDAQRPARGVVLDALGRPLAAAALTPLLVDEVAGSVRRLERSAARSDGDGRFDLAGLPAKVPPHASLVLLVEHPDHGAVASLDLARPASLRDRDLRVSMVARRAMRAAGLPADQPVELIETIRNLSPAAMVRTRAAMADARGEVMLEVADGARLFWRDGETVRVLALAAADVLRPAADVKPPPSIARWAGAVHGADELLVAKAPVRFGGVRAAADGWRRHVSVRDRRGLGKLDTQLFLESGGSLDYLGAFDGTAAEIVVPAGDFRIVAVAADGSVGVANAADVDGDQFTLDVLEPGRVSFPAPLAEPAAVVATDAVVVFEMIDGPFPGLVAHRVLAVGERVVDGLIPGRYRVVLPDGRSGEVVVTAAGDAAFNG